MATPTPGAPAGALPWYGCIGRVGVPTGDGRIILPGGLTNRPLPLPLSWQRSSSDDHMSSVVVGVMTDVAVNPGTGDVMALGYWLDPNITPEVAECRQNVDAGVIGPSMDPGAVEYEWADVDAPGGMGLMMFSAYEVAGATLVNVPAFTGVWLANGTPPAAPGATAGADDEDPADAQDDEAARRALDPDGDGDPQLIEKLDQAAATGTPVILTDPDHDGDVDGVILAAVRSGGWCSMPHADAGRAWSGSAAAGRVASWAGVDKDDAAASAWSKYARAFLWKDPNADAKTRAAYKLGVADVVDGTLTLIPKAVFAVAGVLQGARGGADIPSADQTKLKSVVSGIYNCLDGDRTAPWDDKPSGSSRLLTATRPARPGHLVAAAGDPRPFAALTTPPAQWFEDPQLPGPAPLTVTDDGRVYGHLAAFGVCHVGLPGCVTAPTSAAGYSYFRTGSVRTDAGTDVPVGHLTVGTGHADPVAGYRGAAEHYDHTGATVAVVAAGEDAHGIWVSGAIVPEATAAQVAELKRSPLSGDWRTIGGTLELVAALAVNVPGFPVPRPRVALAASGAQLSLTAAGIVTDAPTPTVTASAADIPTPDELHADEAEQRATAQRTAAARRRRARARLALTEGR